NSTTGAVFPARATTSSQGLPGSVVEVVALAGKTAPVVEFLLWHLRADAVLADESRAIAVLPQERRIGLLPGIERKCLGEIVDLVPAHVLARQETRTATSADRVGDEHVAKYDALRG